MLSILTSLKFCRSVKADLVPEIKILDLSKLKVFGSKTRALIQYDLIPLPAL